MSESRQKTLVIGVRVDPDQHREIARRAKEAGLSAGEFLRRLSLGRKVDFQAKLTAESLHQLARIGNNLNQIAHAINAGQTVIHSDLADTLYMVRNAPSSLVKEGGKS